jgi:hypothetical protein
MSLQHPVHPQIIYRADPSWVNVIKQIRHRIYEIGRRYKNRSVRVVTIDGHVHDGTIVNVDDRHLYLRVSSPPHTHQASPPHPAVGSILTLVLYELLAISLI